VSATATTAVCMACGKELQGRADKRFCSDACRKRAVRVAAADSQSVTDIERQDDPEQPVAEAGEPTYRYLSDWQRDATCQTCGNTFEQLNYAIGYEALGHGESFAVPGVCTSSSERLRPRAIRFEDRWTPSKCPTCEAQRMANEEQLRQSGDYLSDDLPERITITFEMDEAVLVLDSVEELSESVLANLRAAGKLSIAIGSPLQNLRSALGEEHFTRLLEEGKIISTEGSN
jgi:hypothetical protein